MVTILQVRGYSLCICVCVCVRVCSCRLCAAQMEAEPVVASEPMFSAGPAVQVASHAPAIPNGSSTQAKPEERPGRMTAEQLAAIEDEELLDKMVLHTQLAVLNNFTPT